MKWLLHLYPAWWRHRYGEEFMAVLEQERPSVRVVLDVLSGALDARLKRRPVRRPRPLIRCSFCGKQQDAVRRLIAGPGGVTICAEGRLSPHYHAASRPPEVEAEATHRAVALALLARAPLNVVHMTCEASVRHVVEARARGATHIHGETCPQYLLLHVDQYDEPDFQGARYVMSPPLRDRREHEYLWRQLAAGNLQTLMTDHCSFRMADQKTLGRDNFAKIPNGIPGLETRVPIVFSEGVGRGHISLQTMVATMATNPARLYGMYPKKGCLAVGSDADIVLIDPKKRVTLSAASLNQHTDYCPFEGLEVTGYPVLTLSRGEIIAENGRYVGRKARGKFIKRGPYQAP